MFGSVHGSEKFGVFLYYLLLFFNVKNAELCDIFKRLKLERFTCQASCLKVGGCGFFVENGLGSLIRYKHIITYKKISNKRKILTMLLQNYPGTMREGMRSLPSSFLGSLCMVATIELEL